MINEAIIYSLLGTLAWLVVVWLLERRVKQQRRALRFAVRQASAYLDLYRAESNHGFKMLTAIADLRRRILALSPGYELPDFPSSGEELETAIDRVQRLMLAEAFDP